MSEKRGIVMFIFGLFLFTPCITAASPLPNPKDSAVIVMRRAIEKAPFYREQLENYQVSIFMKATLEAEKIPKSYRKKVEKRENLVLKEGDVFTVESVSNIDYTADSCTQNIISVKKDCPKEFDFGNLDHFALYNIYGKMGNFISPLAADALTAYRFELKHVYQNVQGQKIFHIQVIPKYKNRHAFTGFVDITDSTWHVVQFELSASKNLTLFSLRFTLPFA